MKLIRPQQLIADLFEQLSVPPGFGEGYSKEAMHFCLRIHMNNYGYEANGCHRHEDWIRDYCRFIHVIITYSRNVFVAVSDQADLKNVPLGEFTNPSNHESCWRSDGLAVFNQVYHEAWEHCYGWMKNDPEAAPHHSSNRHVANTFTVFGNGFITTQPIHFVKVEHVEEPNSNCGKRKLLAVTEREFSIVFKD